MTRIGIVGAGPAGLTAAIAARHARFDVTVFEQSEELRSSGVGITIAANGVSALEALGLGDEFARSAQKITRASVERTDGTNLLTLDYNLLSGPYNFFSSIARSDLHRLLGDEAVAVGATLRLGKRCVSASPQGELVFEDGERIRFDVVVAADGLNSAVRSALGLKTRRRRRGTAVLQWIADIPVPDLVTREIWGGDGSSALMFPLPNGQTHVACSAPRGWKQIRSDELERWLRSWHAYPKRLTAAMDCVERWDTVRYDEVEEVVVKPWHAGRVILIGDAAHAMAPYAGQGASSSIVDAHTLGIQFAIIRSIEEAARTYESLRRGEVRRMQLFAAAGAAVRQWSSRPMRIGRDSVLRLLEHSNWARRRQMHMLSGL